VNPFLKKNNYKDMTPKNKKADKTKETEMESQQEKEVIKETSQDDKQKGSEKAKVSGTKRKMSVSNLAKTKKKLEESQLNLAEMQDKYLRLSADFDNYRRRTLKEKTKLTKTGGEKVILSLLPIIDNLERAMISIRETKDSDALKEGLELIYGKFQEFLAQNGVKEVESLNAEFDTEFHEAITKIPAPKPELKGKVVDVIERGYFLHDKVVRFAKVVIGE